MIRKVKCNKRLKRKCTSWVYACPHLLWYLYEQINQISINRSISTRGNFMLQFFFNELFSTHILVKRDPWCIGKWASFQFRQSVMSDFATPWTAACQASLSITNSRSSLKLMSIESMMPSNHLILCHPLLLPPSIFPSPQGLFKWINSSHQVAEVVEFQLRHQSFQWTPRTDLL